MCINNIAIRGHENKDSKFQKLCELRAKDDPELEKWILKERGNYMSPECQNQILGIMANRILREHILKPIQQG